MKRSITARRFILSIIALGVLDSLLDDGTSDEVRRLQTRDITEVQSQLRPMGSHFVTVFVGKPAQPQRLKVSLASEFISFPCTGCLNCGDHHTGAYFNYTNSLVHTCPSDCAFKKSRCQDGSQQCIVASSQAAEEDTEGGFRGFEVSDTAYLDAAGNSLLPTNNKGFAMTFVCETQLRGMTQDCPGDGLLSLSMAPSSFISQLYAKGKVSARVFTLCFNDADHYQADDLGSVHFGSIERGHHTSSLFWALNTGKNTIGPKNYAVRIKNLHLGVGGGRNPLVGAAKGTMSIISIGTKDNALTPPEAWLSDTTIQTNKPITQLPRNYEEAFLAAFSKLVGASYDQNGIAMTKKRLESMPTLFLQLEPHKSGQGGVTHNIPGFAGRLDEENLFDIIIAVPAPHYFSYNEHTGIAIPTIRFSNKATFIGANILQGHDLTFDLDNDRIGFAEVTGCDRNPVPTTAGSKGEHGKHLGSGTKTTNVTSGSVRVGTGGGHGLPVEIGDAKESGRSSGRHGKGRAISGDNASNQTIGGQGSQPSEISTGVPPANGHTTFHIGPQALKAATMLNGVNSQEAWSFDWFNLLGLLMFLGSFCITVFATRDKDNSRKDKKFKPSDTPLSYDDPDLEKYAWGSKRRSHPEPPEYNPPPFPHLLVTDDDVTQPESHQHQDSFRSIPHQQSFSSEQKNDSGIKRGIGLQMWSRSTKDFFDKATPVGTGSRQPSQSSNGSQFLDDQSQMTEQSDASYFFKKPKGESFSSAAEYYSASTASQSGCESQPDYGKIYGEFDAASHQRSTEDEFGAKSYSEGYRAEAYATGDDRSVPGFSQQAPDDDDNKSKFSSDDVVSRMLAPPDYQLAYRNSGHASRTEGSPQREPSISGSAIGLQESHSTFGSGYVSSVSDSHQTASASHLLGISLTQSDARTATLEDRSHAEAFSLPGSDSVSSLPGIAAAYEKIDEQQEYEVDDEVVGEVGDYFPGPDEVPFVPGQSTTGYLMARPAEDDQSLLTTDEFLDTGSVSTRETLESRMDATHASASTAIRNNRSFSNLL